MLCYVHILRCIHGAVWTGLLSRPGDQTQAVVLCGADCEVYSWGNNAMGQCGLGHCQGPVTSPKLVTALRGSRVQQISAGTSHSLAWTAIPSDRYSIHELNLE